tara:strand:- start:1442 stop:2374 length:933 start_codon:yes stop_codon:yes gene_type:complete
MKHYWKKWLDRRIPLNEKVELSQRSIFILPSKIGFMFALLLILLMVTAINYQNSLIFALAFWLFSVALSAMIFSFRNLSGLVIKTSHPAFGFVGEHIEIPIRLKSNKRQHQGLEIAWLKEDLREVAIMANKEKEITIPFQLQKRGHLETPRLSLKSYYPFGLYKCWTWLSLKTPGVVFPKPIFSPFIAGEGEGNDTQSDISLSVGNDEFMGFRNYQVGDSLKHVAWKYLAKGKGLLSKEYDSQQLSMQWLDWHSLQNMSLESRLSHLCGWVLQAEQEGRAYGLRLPTITIQPGQGDQHRTHCLTQLALYS